MTQPLWRDLIKQFEVGLQYDVLKVRGYSDYDTAIHLARFAEARILNAADKRITELEIELTKVVTDGQVQWRLADLERRMNEYEGD